MSEAALQSPEITAPGLGTPGPLRVVLMAAGVGVWGVAIFGSLQLHSYSGLVGHGICGPWGCAAAPEALIGYHAFLLSVMAPALVLVCRFMPASMRTKFALSLLLVGVVGATAIAGVAAVDWLQQSSSGQHQQYTLQRAGFMIVTTPDLPVVQLALSGLACLAAGNLTWRTRGDRPQQSDADAAGSPEMP